MFPVLQKHYAAVQALALGEESADWEEKDDLVVPDEEGIATFDVRWNVRHSDCLAGPSSPTELHVCCVTSPGRNRGIP